MNHCKLHSVKYITVQYTMSASLTHPDRPVYAVYRQCSLGVSLTSTLQQLVDNDQLNDHEAMQVLFQFDKSINKLLVQHCHSECSISGELNSYRYRDQVWQLVTKNIKLRYIDSKLGRDIGNATPHNAIKLIDIELSKLNKRSSQLNELVQLNENEEQLNSREIDEIQSELKCCKSERDMYTQLKKYILTELQQYSDATQLSIKLKQAIYNVCDKTLTVHSNTKLDDNNQPIIDSRGRKLIESVKIVACELPRAIT